VLGSFVAGAQAVAQEKKYTLANQIVLFGGAVSALKDMATNSETLSWKSLAKQRAGVVAPALVVMMGLAVRKHFKNTSQETRDAATHMLNLFALTNLPDHARNSAWREFDRALMLSKGKYL
jgi:hypothetical protein